MGWRDRKHLYEDEDASNEAEGTPPGNRDSTAIEKMPSYTDGWEKVFPAGDVKTNPPYWRKDSVIIPDKEWIEKYHNKKAGNQ